MQSRPAIKICYFNMIEVVLAMAIIAFGMTSILGLFPVGLNALRASMADNSCSDAIDQMGGYLKNQAEYSATTFSNMISAGTALPSAKTSTAGGKSADTLSAEFIAAYLNNDTSTYAPVFADWNIYMVPAGANFPYIYFIVQGPINSKAYDFAAMALVWKSPVVYNMKNSSGAITQMTDSAYAEFAGLNFEVSWPLQKPYAEREKRYYYIEVKKP
jgi:hypothetical protein